MTIALTEERRYQLYDKLEQACGASDLTAVKQLLEAGAEPCHAEWEKQNKSSCFDVLAYARDENQAIQICRLLKGKGADIHQRQSDCGDGKLLKFTISKKHFALAECLIKEFGLSPDAEWDPQETMLHVFAYLNRMDAVQFLLNMGADPTCRDGWKKTAAGLTKDKDIRQLLEQAAKDYQASKATKHYPLFPPAEESQKLRKRVVDQQAISAQLKL